jgi:hypothetical protein
MKRSSVAWWCAVGQFWAAQAGLCSVRRDFYRMLARNSTVPIMGQRPLESVSLYCQMQAHSCDTQGHLCRMMAGLFD